MTKFIKDAMPDRFRRVARMVGLTLFADGLLADVWHGVTLVLEAPLTPEERAALAWAALRALPVDTVIDVANAVLPYRSHAPIPPLFSYLDEAMFWADMAESAALDAYCLSCFERMSPERREAFLRFVQQSRAA